MEKNRVCTKHVLFFFLNEWFMQYSHCSWRLHYDLKILEDTHRLQANTVPLYIWDMGILGFLYSWMWRAEEDVPEHCYTAVFEFIMVSHSIKKAEDLDPAKVTLKDIRDLRCLQVPSLSHYGDNSTEDGGGIFRNLSAVCERGKDADPKIQHNISSSSSKDCF